METLHTAVMAVFAALFYGFLFVFVLHVCVCFDILYRRLSRYLDPNDELSKAVSDTTLTNTENPTSVRETSNANATAAPDRQTAQEN